METRYQYDMAGQLTDLVHSNGSQILAASHYALDVLGRRTAQTREDALAENYGYDAISEVTSVDYSTSPVKRESFAYDPAGNRTSATYSLSPLAPSLTTYTSNALNQYTSVGGNSFVYDANGNLLNDGKQSYAYDAQNRLIAVEGASTRAEFYYDPRNRCVLRKYYTNGSQSKWILDQAQSRALAYDAQWNLLAERTLDGAQVGDYTLGLRTDEILVAHVNGQSVRPLTDGLGSTVALTNKQGKVTDRYRYDVFGQPRVLTAAYKSAGLSSSTYRFLFTGREWLSSVSLNDHRNRYYLPALGRWLSVDQYPDAEISQGANLYWYGGNDVTNKIDVDGFKVTEVEYTSGDYDDSNILSHAASHFSPQYGWRRGYFGPSTGSPAVKLSYANVCPEPSFILGVRASNVWGAYATSRHEAYIDVQTSFALMIQMNPLKWVMANDAVHLFALCSDCNSLYAD